jgi:hypothetical protein
MTDDELDALERLGRYAPHPLEVPDGGDWYMIMEKEVAWVNAALDALPRLIEEVRLLRALHGHGRPLDPVIMDCMRREVEDTWRPL